MGRPKLRPPRDPKFSPKQIREFRKREESLKTEIGKIAAREAEKSGIDTCELIQILGYSSTSQLSKWKSGKASVPVEKVAILAEALGCSITYFFPAYLHQRDWVDDLQLAIYKVQRKRAIEILLAQLPDDDGEEER